MTADRNAIKYLFLRTMGGEPKNFVAGRFLGGTRCPEMVNGVGKYVVHVVVLVQAESLCVRSFSTVFVHNQHCLRDSGGGILPQPPFLWPSFSST